MDSSVDPETRIIIADLVIDVGRRTVTRSQDVIPLGKLTFDLLLCLVESAPNLVSRQQIADRVWDGRFVTSQTVVQRIKLLRKALGDDAQSPRYVRVVRGQGYRLIPPVETIAPSAGSAPNPLAERTQSRRTAIWQLGAVGMIPVVLGGAQLVRSIGMPRRYSSGELARMTRHTDLEIDPAGSPDGNWVAYARGRLGRMHVYLKRVDSDAAPINLTAGIPGEHRLPRWSRSGDKIAYRTTDATTHHAISVYHVASDSHHQAIISGRLLAGHDWSPLRDELVVADGAARQIRIVSYPELQQRVLLDLAEPNAPVWSPDGKQILFVSGNPWYSYYSGGDLLNVADCAIWCADVDSGHSWALMEADGVNTSPAWAGDGRSFFFVSDREGRRHVFNALLPSRGAKVDPANVERLADGLNAHTIDVSPDGSRMLYSEFALTQNIWRYPIPADGPKAPRFAELTPVTMGEQMIEAVSMSPDRRWLLFDTDADSGDMDLKWMPLDREGPTVNLRADSANDFQPQLSPNGKEIVFYSMRDGVRQLFVGSIEGVGLEARLVDVVQVTDGPGQARYPQWGHNGDSIVYYQDETGDNELYRIDRDRRTLDWGDPIQLTSDGHGRAHQISPSGDGSLVYYGNFGSGPPGLIRMEADGERELLTPLDNPYIYFAYSPDGGTVYIKQDDFGGQGGPSSFWSIPATGGERRLLLSLQNASPSGFDRREFDVDETYFYFTLAERRSDIWRIQLRPAAS